MNARTRHRLGFSLLELMVVVAIIGIGLALAVPYFGKTTKIARERNVVSKLLQDFDWNRSAAGVGDAGSLGVAGIAAGSGIPVVTMLLGADCTWTTKINTITDTSHSMTAAQLTALAPGITCASGLVGGLALPTTFTFIATGTVNASGNVVYSGTGGATWPLQFMSSGSVIRSQSAN